MLDLISVVIPTYNRNELLFRAIDSVLKQTYKNFELLIVDDGSEYNIKELFLKRYADHRIHWIAHHKRGGAAAARNTGIRAAQGKYIAFLDSDDEWLPEKLSLQISEFIANGSDAAISLTGFLLDRIDRNVREHRYLPKIKNWHHYFMYGCNVSPGSTLMVRRDVFDDIGYFNEKLERLEDWEWLIRATQKFSVCSIHQMLAIVHLGSWPGVHIVQSAIVEFQSNMIYQSYDADYFKRRTLKAVCKLEQSVAFWRNNFRMKGILHFLKSSLYYPDISLKFCLRILGRRIRRWNNKLFKSSVIIILEHPQIPQEKAQFANILYENIQYIQLGELKRWLKQNPFAMFQKYHCGILLVSSLGTIRKSIFLVLALRWLCRSNVMLQDIHGDSQYIRNKDVIKQLFYSVINHWTKLKVTRNVTQICKTLNNNRVHTLNAINFSGRPIYLRTDLIFGVRAGGSVSHIAGILNNLEFFGGPPLFFTTDKIPTIKDTIETYHIPTDHLPWNIPDLCQYDFNKKIMDVVLSKVSNIPVSFVYQRYSVGNISGLLIARHLKVPYVCEYNGSEVWVARNWGNPLPYEKLALKTEDTNLQCADLVIVVSDPLKSELIAKGISPKRILVNPNGVDTEQYSPNICGDEIREKYNIKNNFVVGFIGTFGVWHGAPLLAKAFGNLFSKGIAQDWRLLMVGDGNTMPETLEIIKKHHADQASIFPGIVPQAEGAKWMAACDVLVLPHIPNVDGSPFFGSPIKLFEYMAMGKCILASNLDQIGEILKHEHTAFLVDPGCSDSIEEGLVRLYMNPLLRQKLGMNARIEAENKHNWYGRTKNFINYLQILNTQDNFPLYVSKENLTPLEVLEKTI